MQKVESFVDHLLSESEKYNLTAVRNKEDAYTRYVSTVFSVFTRMECDNPEGTPTEGNKVAWRDIDNHCKLSPAW